jgi:hypothetical protein
LRLLAKLPSADLDFVGEFQSHVRVILDRVE